MAYSSSMGGIGGLGRSSSVSGVNSPMNTDALIAHLVEMTPDQRKQFASMHADDPMMLSAAKYVDNKFKQDAQNMMARQNAVQPPVNQQAVAGMAGTPAPTQMAQGLPEESGIGTLPVPEMKHMATGGIVAFGGGGDVPRYNGASDSLINNPSAYDPYAYGYATPSAEKQTELRARATPPQLTSTNRDITAQAKFKQMNGLTLTPSEAAALENTSTGSVFTPNPTSGFGGTKATGSPDMSSGPNPTAPPKPTPNPAALNARLAPGAAPTSTEDLKRLQSSLMPQGPEADPYAAEHAQNAADRQAISQERLDAANAREAGLAALLAPKEQRIKDREARLQKNDDMNLNMSLINAGLAMMQSRGQGLSGIAEGAGVGVKQYTEGLKLSEAARQKIEDAKDAFDELKFNQTNMSKKEIADAKAAIKEGAIVSRNEGVAARMAATGEKRADATKLFETYVTTQNADKDRASRERTAAFNAQVQKEIAAMPGAQEKLFAALGGGDVKKGFAYYTEQTNEGKGMEAIITAAAKDPMVLQNLPPEIQAIVKQRMFAQLTPNMVSGTPAAGQIAPR
jgi:hypothetical protein